MKMSLAHAVVASLGLLATPRDTTLDGDGSVSLTHTLGLDDALATINLAKATIVLGTRRRGGTSFCRADGGGGLLGRRVGQFLGCQGMRTVCNGGRIHARSNCYGTTITTTAAGREEWDLVAMIELFNSLQISFLASMSLAHSSIGALSLLGTPENPASLGFGAVTLTHALRLDDASASRYSTEATLMLEGMIVLLDYSCFHGYCCWKNA